MNLNQVTIPSLSLERSIKFYKTLGMQLIVDAEPRYARFLCPDGNATFSVHLVAELPQGESTSIYFEDDNLDELVNKLQQKDIIFISQPEDKSWLWREAHLKDPDGNNIILYYAGKNRINPPWRID